MLYIFCGSHSTGSCEERGQEGSVKAGQAKLKAADQKIEKVKVELLLCLLSVFVHVTVCKKKDIAKGNMLEDSTTGTA